MSCKTCGKKFHACGSCGLDYEWEWTYCSYECYLDSDELKVDAKRASTRYKELRAEHEDIKDLIEDFMEFMLDHHDGNAMTVLRRALKEVDDE